MKEIILASTSPRRRGLLQQIGLDFRIVPSKYEEDMTLKMGPSRLAMHLAEGKARDVASRVTNGIVLGVDTFVALGSKRIGKPHTPKKAARMLRMISGKSIKVYSGLVLIEKRRGKADRIIRDYEMTTIKIKRLSAKEIASYVRTKEPLDKAGAIAMQGMGAIFVESVKGCYSNVIGLPLALLYRNLKKLGINIFSHEKWKNYVQ